VRPTLFSETILEEARKLEPEPDGVFPGTWYVMSGEDEYKVQTDEEIWDGQVYWASCTCPHGASMTGLIARCSHVASVLLILLDDGDD
jgi:hypothetical protein